MARSVFSLRPLPCLVALPLSLAFTAFIYSPVAVAAPPLPATATKAAEPPTPTMQVIVAQGVVRDPEGKPLKGASVEALSIWGNSDPTRFQTTATQTDEKGHFQVEARLSAGGLVDLQRWYKTQEGEDTLPVGVYAPGYALTRILAKSSRQKGAALPANEVALERGFSATGQVVSAEGKPAPNIRVGMSSIFPAPNSQSGGQVLINLGDFTEDGAIVRAFQVVSDKDGRFTVHDLPPGTLSVALSDPRYVQETVGLTASAQPIGLGPTPTLTLRPAATLRGRVLYGDGKPVGQVRVVVRSAMGGSVSATSGLTKPDGTFAVGGLAAGQVSVAVRSSMQEWTGASVSDIALKASQETNVGDLTLTPGILLTGSVREAGSKAPLEGVTVTAAMGGIPLFSTKTDAQGRYQIRSQTGETSFTLSSIPPDYIRHYEPPKIKVGAQSQAAPDFYLSKGLTLSGTAKDEKGQPAAGASFDLGDNYGSVGGAVVDAKGNWMIRGFDPNNFSEGPLTLKVGGEWALLTPVKVTRNQPLLNLTLRRLTLQDVKAKVVTPDGKPVAGASVTAKVSGVTNADFGQTSLFTSDAAGEVVIPRLRPDQTVELTAIKKGYTLTQSGQVTRSANFALNANVPQRRGSDIILTPLTGTLTGRVVDAKGQPARGARLALLSANDLRDLPDSSVVTDDQGQFKMTGLPQGELIIGAAQGRAYTQTTVQANGTLELKLGEAIPLVAPHDTEAAFAQLQGWVAAQPAGAGALNQSGLVILANMLARYDVARTQHLVTDANGTLNMKFLSVASKSLAGSDAPQIAAWGKTVLPLLGNKPENIDVKLCVAALVAGNDPATAQAIYDEIAPGITLGSLDGAAGTRYAELAALALALHNPDAEGWLQALSLCAAAHPDGDDEVSNWATLLAGGDLGAARKWATQLKPTKQVIALSGLTTWAATRDLPVARQLLQELETLLARPDFPVEPTRGDGQYLVSSIERLDIARISVARALMATNPKAALEIIRPLATTSEVIISLHSEAQARAAGPTDAEGMRAALKTQGEFWQHPIAQIARVASLTHDTLPQISEEGFAQARSKMATHESDAYGDTAASYAYARASFDPTESRLLLENAWLRDLGDARQPAAGAAQADISQQIANLARIASAMIPLDVARANAMVAQFPAGSALPYYTTMVRKRIIKWLLSDEADRRAMTVEDSNEDVFEANAG